MGILKTDEKANGADPEKVIRGSYQVTLNVAGRNISISGYIQDGEGKDAINKRLDEANDMIERQSIRADNQKQEASLKADEHNRKTVMQKYQTILDRRKNGGKIHSTDQQNLDNYETTLDNIQRSMDFARAQIEENNKRLSL